MDGVMVLTQTPASAVVSIGRLNSYLVAFGLPPSTNAVPAAPAAPAAAPAIGGRGRGRAIVTPIHNSAAPLGAPLLACLLPVIAWGVVSSIFY